MSDKLKMKGVRLAVGYAEDDQRRSHIFLH